MLDFQHWLDVNKIPQHNTTHTTPPLCIEQYECMYNSKGGFAPDLAVFIHISAPTSNSHLKSTLRRLSHAAVCETAQQVLCIHLCFHSCVHSDAQCHLKLNSEENQYDKLLLVLSLNCFSLEIDTGARAIHHRLREVGAPR